MSLCAFLDMFFNTKWMLLLTGGVVLAALLAYYPDLADDYDIWWHLKYGEHFIRYRTITVDPSIFSWTPASSSWAYVTWIGSSVLFLVHAAGGYTALAVMQWLVFFAMTGLFFLFLRSCQAPLAQIYLAGLLLTGVAMNSVAVYIKPELFSMLFFTIAAFVYFLSKVSRKNYFWIYPPLFAVWVNTHGGFVNGLTFITIALVAETVCYACRDPDRMTWSLLLKLAFCVLLSCAAALLNPYGAVYWINILENAAQGGSHIHSINAYTPLWGFLFPAGYPFRKTNTAWCMVLMAFVLLALAVAARVQKKKTCLAPLALNIIFFVLGFSVLRASIYFCILWLFTSRYLLHLAGWRPSAFVNIAAFCFSLCLSGMILYETAVYNTYNSWFGSRIRYFIPADAAAFVEQQKLPGPLFNDYLSGGYLIWALSSSKVFIDPRYGPYLQTGVWHDYLALVARGDLGMLDAKYRCNTAIIMNTNYRLIKPFLKSPDWILVYFDAVDAVFVRTTCLNLPRAMEWRNLMRPERFSAIASPRVLLGVFSLYCAFHPPSALKIIAYYERNVRNCYCHKAADLRRMKAACRQLGIRQARLQ